MVVDSEWIMSEFGKFYQLHLMTLPIYLPSVWVRKKHFEIMLQHGRSGLYVAFSVATLTPSFL